MSETKVEKEEVVQEIVVAETPVAEAPKPILAAGLFKPFTLGSTLERGEVGNRMSNLKQSPMDYEKTYQDTTHKNSISEEDLKKLAEGKVKKSNTERESVLAELDRRIEEAKKSNNDSEVQRIENAKKAWEQSS